MQEIYTQCTTCDEVSTEKMEKNCDSRILVNENSKELNVKDNNNDNDDDIIDSYLNEEDKDEKFIYMCHCCLTKWMDFIILE